MSELKISFQVDIKGNIKEKGYKNVEEMSWNEFPLIILFIKMDIEGFNRIMINIPSREHGFRGCGGGP